MERNLNKYAKLFYQILPRYVTLQVKVEEISETHQQILPRRQSFKTRE